MALVTALATRLEMQWYAKLCAVMYPNRPPAIAIHKNGLTQNGDLVLNAADFNVGNVFEAADLAGRILGRFVAPAQPDRFRLLYRYTSHLYRKVARYVDVS
jgi:hypothetical protein